eukprot:TRINITY_DN93118_c0_g1_i1.p3 TRINITY_DN93118_c0_g1~~TRINITY_DN93118_c0_g1_i1.p3  ORF type:complete len:110 (+),score=14.68 TRINITY_DN93118_c0_g1_i1:111-440(+)
MFSLMRKSILGAPCRLAYEWKLWICLLTDLLFDMGTSKKLFEDSCKFAELFLANFSGNSKQLSHRDSRIPELTISQHASKTFAVVVSSTEAWHFRVGEDRNRTEMSEDS